MERNIPHVLDIFTTSPGERRRRREKEQDKIANHLKEQQKNPGSDSAVSLDSSDEDERNISKYFDYLDDDAEDDFAIKNKRNAVNNKGKENKPNNKERDSRKSEFEKDIKHIERHLSMKKTIRKKMMRDLQQAFVENPGEFQQDPARLSKEKKNNIDINNLTISKKRMSKSEHSFLDMLKENETKDKKLVQLKVKSTNMAKDDSKISSKFQNNRTSKHNLVDEDDSGNDSPTREKFRISTKKEISKPTTTIPVKEEKKISFWKRITGKGTKTK